MMYAIVRTHKTTGTVIGVYGPYDYAEVEKQRDYIRDTMAPYGNWDYVVRSMSR